MILILIFGSCLTTYAFSTTRWSFKLYGNPNAESVALNLAQIQKELKESEEDPYGPPDSLEMFQDMLIRQILSKITRNIVDQAFGDGELAEGEYEVGNYIIVITDTGDGVAVEITDTLTGNTTVIDVPYWNYTDPV